MKVHLPFVVLMTLVPTLALAGDSAAENHLVDAAIAYRAKEWDAARAALSEARAEVSSTALRAKIERQEALVLVALDRPADALKAFRRAVGLDPLVEFEAWRFGPAERTLFECAHRLPASFPRVERLESDGRRGWICPLDRERAEESAAVVETTESTEKVAETVEGETDEAELPGLLPDDVSGEPEARPAGLPPIGIVEPAPSKSSFGGLGGFGVTLMVIGLGGGGGVFGWQTVVAGDHSSTVDGLTPFFDDPRSFPGTEEELVAQYNTAQQDRIDAENLAQLSAAIGGGVAGLGVVLLVIDLLDGPGGPSPIETAGFHVSGGLGSASLTFEF